MREPTLRKARVAFWRLHYNWSNPNRATIKTTDSNVWGGTSSHTYNFTRRSVRATDIDVVVARGGKNLKGWIVGPVLCTIGLVEKAFEDPVEAIEQRRSRALGRVRLCLSFECCTEVNV